jgi:hypothetical protein
VRVRQLSERSELALEQRGRFVRARAQLLERELPARGDIPHAVHEPHPAPAESLEHVVARADLSWLLVAGKRGAR